MKVGVIGPLEADSFADNIVDSLKEMNIETIALGPVRRSFGRRVDALADVASRMAPTVDVRWQARLVDKARVHRCDLIVCVSAALMPESVAALRRDGARVVLWFPDAVANLDRQLMMIADYDRLFFKDRVLVERLIALTNLPVSYLPEACNPHWHRPGVDSERIPEIVVAGNMYPSRIRLLDRLHADGIPLRLYGNGFARWIPDRPIMSRHAGKSITRSEKAKVFRNAAGVLNNLHPSEISGVNCRLFEATGCGAATLCEDRPALRECFEVGKEVLAFATYAELQAHCEFLIANLDAGRVIGNAATQRAHSEHTYARRLTDLLEQVFSG